MAASGPALTPAKDDDLHADARVFVRGRPATVVDVDFPLVFFRFEGEEVVKHRSFRARPEDFQVDRSAAGKPKGGKKPRKDSGSDTDTGETGGKGGGSGEDWNPFGDEEGADNGSGGAGGAGGGGGRAAGGGGKKDDNDTVDSLAAAGAPISAEERKERQVAGNSLAALIGSRTQPTVVSDQNNTVVELDDVDMQSGVQVVNCSDVSVHVRGKIAHLLVRDCKSVNVHFQTVISAAELLRVTNCEMHCSARCSLFSLEDAIRCQVFFPADEPVKIVTRHPVAARLIAEAEDGKQGAAKIERVVDSMQLPAETRTAQYSTSFGGGVFSEPKVVQRAAHNQMPEL
jgi:hypothetical protein